MEKETKATSECAKPARSSRQTVQSTRQVGSKSVAGKPRVTAVPNNAKEELFRQVGKMLTQHPWYHGLMPRCDCEENLKQVGDFLVRKTTVGKVPTYCISVRTVEEPKHVPVTFKNAQWTLKDVTCNTLTELITHFVTTATPIGPPGSGPNACAILIQAIPRPDYYILHENVTVGDKLGSGAFGDVHKGILHRPTGDITCAIKKLKGTMQKKQLAEFMKEGKLMRRFDNRNIVRIYGLAPQEEPIMIILEFAAGGTLKDYCKKNPRVTNDTLMGFARDAARGMTYLASQQVIHRDLAARNCLLGEELELKISDFGLSLADTNEVKLDKLKSMPIKWLAPETLLEGKFSTKTDVWSFGVLLWEIFSRCKTDPFPGETNAEAKEKIIAKKPPMEPPNGAPVMVGAAMMLCFTKSSESRPDFEAVLHLLSPNEKLFEKNEKPSSVSVFIPSVGEVLPSPQPHPLSPHQVSPNPVSPLPVSPLAVPPTPVSPLPVPATPMTSPHPPIPPAGQPAHLYPGQPQPQPPLPPTPKKSATP